MAIAPPPFVSVAIPTHNRATSLVRTLDALARDTYPPDRIEVVIALNSCTDDSARRVGALALPFAIRVIEVTPPSIARARNAAVQAAFGDVVVMLDDDIEVLPGCLGALVRGLGDDPARLAVGALLAPEPTPGWGYMADWLAREDRDSAVRLGEMHAGVEHVDVPGANIALRRALYLAVGGCDESLGAYGGVDADLAFRLHRAGVRMVPAPEARAIHHRPENTGLGDFLAKARARGANDARQVRRWPELLPYRALKRALRSRSRAGSLARAYAFEHQGVGDAAAGALRLAAAAAEALCLHSAWERLMISLRDYWYFRGVSDAVGGRAGLTNLVDESATSLPRIQSSTRKSK